MLVTMLTYGIVAAILLSTGIIFFSSVVRALQQHAEHARLGRQVEALARLDDVLERRSSISREDPPWAEETPVMPDTLLPRPKRSAVAEAHARSLERAGQQKEAEGRLSLLSSALVSSDKLERQLLAETTLEPWSEESIRAFLQKAREMDRRREMGIEERRESTASIR